ncbi:hypothetical protein EYC85_24500 [Enterobacter hormaechei]|nr:hypothetical protein EYC85_24500 [Enterobacter hormaechei]
MPAAAVIPAPIAYTKVAAVKKLVVGSRERAGGPPRGEPPPVPVPPLPPGAPRMPLAGCPVPGARSVYFEKIRVFKAGRPSPLNTAARNNGIGLRFYFVGFWNPVP